jgi:hypothetical protein
VGSRGPCDGWSHGPSDECLSSLFPATGETTSPSSFSPSHGSRVEGSRQQAQAPPCTHGSRSSVFVLASGVAAVTEREVRKKIILIIMDSPYNYGEYFLFLTLFNTIFKSNTS